VVAQKVVLDIVCKAVLIHAHETLLWASKSVHHAFNYDLINSPNGSPLAGVHQPSYKARSAWTTTRPRSLSGSYDGRYLPQRVKKISSSIRSAALAPPWELPRSKMLFRCAELEEEYAGLAARRQRGRLLLEISEQFRSEA